MALCSSSDALLIPRDAVLVSLILEGREFLSKTLWCHFRWPRAGCEGDGAQPVPVLQPQDPLLGGTGWS